jgi:hypothetical protein
VYLRLGGRIAFDREDARMAMIRRFLVAAGTGVGLALAVSLVPSAASAKPTHTTSVKIPAGAKIQKMNNGRVAIRNNGGLGVGGTYSCSCSAEGSCSTVQTEGVLQCGKDGDSCKGSCDMSTTTTGGGKIMMMKRN